MPDPTPDPATDPATDQDNIGVFEQTVEEGIGVSETSVAKSDPEPDKVPTVSLAGLRKILEERSLVLSSATLSEFINTDDIAEQLGVTQVGNRKEYPLAAAEVLLAFYPMYKAAKGRLPQAAGMLRGFLQKAQPDEPSDTTSDVSETPLDDLAVGLAPMTTSAEQREREHLARLQGMGAGDRILNAHDAAAVLGIGVGLLRRSVKPFRRFGKSSAGDRWRLSDLFREDPSDHLTDVSETPTVAPMELPKPTEKMLLESLARPVEGKEVPSEPISEAPSDHLTDLSESPIENAKQ